MLREALSGRRILLTGVTGFVGEGLLARLLAEIPDVQLTLLVRPRGGASGAERVAALAHRPAFSAVAQAPRLLAAARVVESHLGESPVLPSDLDVVVHCAGEVSFDPPIDDAFQTNVHGVAALLRALDACGCAAHYVHVSTAYVSGRRRGAVPEAPLEHAVDWREEAAAAARLRDVAQDASRSPAMLRRFQRDAAREHRQEGAQAVAADAERRRVDWVRDRLVAAGAERARSLGWTDAYTFTKALGERVAEELGAGRPVSVLRPSIIESALRWPFPGWIEGFKMAEPIILAYGRGALPEFPAAPDGVADIVPVDHVVAALLAVAAHPPAPGAPSYYHLASGARNRLSFGGLHEHVHNYFLAHPFEQAGRGTPRLPAWRWRGGASVDRLLRTGERAHGVADAVVSRLPRSERVRDLSRSLDRQGARLEFLRRYYDLYLPYTDTEVTFTDDAALALFRSLPEADRIDFSFDAAEIDWRHYLMDVHCPAVTGAMRGALSRRRPPAAAGVGEPAAGERALAVFDMDGTLVASNVVESYLWLRLHGQGPAARIRELRSLAGRLPGYLAADRRDRAEFLRAIYRRYEGARLADIEALLAGELAPMVLSRLLPGAVRQVRAHRAAGHRTVLVTGAIRPLTAPLAGLFDEVVAADLLTDARGRATGFLAHPPVVGEARAAWLRRYADQGDFDLAASYAYADAHTDLPMLHAVGHPVAVNPDVRLYRAARRARWPVQVWGGSTPRARAAG